MLPTVNATVPSSNPFYVAPIGGRCVTVAYSLFLQIGTISRPYRSKAWNATVGFKFRPLNSVRSGDFRATVYYAHGEASEIDDRRRNGVNAGLLQAALNDTNPATALNVFGGPNNAATVATLTDNQFVIIGRTRLGVVNAQMDGSLFELPGGNVRIAIGGEHRVEYTFIDLITGRAAAPVSVKNDGSRNVDAAFAELFVPIVGAGNASPLIQKLNLSLAVRYEHYSDFGSTTNPKRRNLASRSRG